SFWFRKNLGSTVCQSVVPTHEGRPRSHDLGLFSTEHVVAYLQLDRARPDPAGGRNLGRIPKKQGSTCWISPLPGFQRRFVRPIVGNHVDGTVGHGLKLPRLV